MDRIPLPPHIIAAQQRIQVNSQGEVTRDRLVVVHQKEIQPVMVTDPVAREYYSRQLGRMDLENSVGAQAGAMMLTALLILLLGIPSFIYVGVRFF
jgi:hypothetical protein